MKRTVGLVVDSTFGLDSKYVKENNISVVALKVIIDGKEFIDGQLAPNQVVDALKSKKSIKTSQPSPEHFMQAYEKQLINYDEVICLTIAKSLSGTNNSANLGKTIMENNKIHVVDSETNINGGMYLTEKLIEFLDEGHNVQDALVYLEELKNKGSLIFTVDNLQTLVANGRLGRVQATIGNILKIKPILRFRKGVLDLEHKVRSSKNVMLYLVNEAKKLMDFGKVVVRIAYVDQSAQAKELQHEIFQLGENVDVKITGVISPVVSAHVGLGGLGIYLAYE
ncbi:DegV family protein [Peloplasma aerotolerans]|jgi:DegV family protein with EDD domain|uniref:DegV family protein n=1 Tax=Peloplasma aerotolerans TaxID=3044389 RepID=A0AAW6U874_9MOLU|nr:DegV family protein [Mariniplasma sp. M4Ah]MDI6452149.1 DegV family protein [Mariniplasma sp. M4Ah]